MTYNLSGSLTEIPGAAVVAGATGAVAMGAAREAAAAAVAARPRLNHVSPHFSQCPQNAISVVWVQSVCHLLILPILVP